MSKKYKRKYKLEGLDDFKLGENCLKCGFPMERRSHGPEESAYLEKDFYFSEWDYCFKCKYVQHYKKFKVFNPNGRVRVPTKKIGVTKKVFGQNSLF